MGFDFDSTYVDWEISEDGNLEIEVKPQVRHESTSGNPVLQEAEALEPEPD